MINTVERLKALGINAPADFRGFITKDNRAQIAQDAALVTSANALTPAYLGEYIDRVAVEILTAPRNARAVFGEVKKGDWETPFAQFHSVEFTGTTTPYSDFTENTRAGVNYNWPTRKQYRFQTTIDYGDLEAAVSGIAGVNLVSDKQQSAAHIIDVDANKFALFGVAGYEIYGMLNDPNLPAAETPSTGAGGGLTWAVYGITFMLTQSEVGGYFAATLFAASYAEIMARIRKYPAISYLVVSIFPLIPGAGIYYATNHLVAGDLTAFTNQCSNTVSIAGAIAVGILIVSTIVRFRSILQKHRLH